MKKHISMITLIIGISGGFLAAIAAYIQYVEKKNEEREKNVQQKKAEEYQHKFENLLLQQKDSISEVLELSQKLNAAQEENVRLSSELYYYTVGGDSYCYITLHNSPNRENVFYITVIMNGKYPLKNISAKLTDQTSQMNFTYNSLFENVINIGDLNSQQSVLSTQNKITLNPDREAKILIQYSSSSKHFYQLIRMKKTGQIWCKATIVRELLSSEVLYKDIDGCYGENEDEIFQ